MIERTTRLGVAAAVTAAALMLTSCAASAGDNEMAGPAAVNVVWKGDATRAGLIESVIDLYKASNPDVVFTSDYQSGDEYLQKLSIRFASNDAPDLLRQERGSLLEYADRGVLADLNQLTSLDTSAVPDSALDAGLVGDKLYGLSGGLTSLAYAVNAAAFEQYGVAVPDTTTWSWDEYLASAAELTAASGGAVWGTDFPVGDIAAFGVYLRQNGEDLWTADGEVGFTESTLEDWYELWGAFKDAGASPNGGAVDDLGAAADQSLIGRGIVASSLIPVNSFASFNAVANGELVLADFPGESKAKQRGQQIMPSMYWAISASSKNQEAAASFLDFLLNDVEANKLLGSTHGVPPNPDVAVAVAADLEPDDKTAFEYITVLAADDLITPLPDPAGTTQLLNDFVSTGDQIRFGQLTASQAAEQFYQTASSSLRG